MNTFIVKLKNGKTTLGEYEIADDSTEAERKAIEIVIERENLKANEDFETAEVYKLTEVFNAKELK